jgi:hypothetical protein
LLIPLPFRISHEHVRAKAERAFQTTCTKHRVPKKFLKHGNLLPFSGQYSFEIQRPT